ncbi:ferric reductase-like transmembrane domain-containing protein [Actinoplanes sp. TRM 88003]|uniref:Ferric reductase-like transmembrane domain-containing protein n=1 Tax=Paractinoplanes aksuensis TaxID=2939490 RepID=A0ABT1DJW0_9ACTN|nr:ferric reductase-like transmembrane domain-containing protein [Actinoplanes aksuensis]MCO8271128.1 ferric reductase-like transmembrane domain-containing protein [Actinoplanes aksuensis]
MTTATRPQLRLTGQARAAYVLLWAFLLLNLVIVELMLTRPNTPAHNTLTTIGRVLGLHLGFALALQLLLIARLPFLDRRIGLDRLTGWHRWTGFAIFWLVLLHPTFVLLGYSQPGKIPILSEIPTLAKQLPVALGMIAAILIGVIAATSVRAVRKRVPYEAWHTIHLLVYAVIVLGVVHQVYEGSAFKTNNYTQAYWWGLWAFAIGALLTGRVFLPLIRNLRHRMRVAAVVAEAPDVVSVHVTGRDLHKLHARAGQFFLWRFPGHNRWWQVNPWSLSAAPDGHSLRLTAKAIGTTSAGLRDLPVGTRVFAEGPYGAFTATGRTRTDTLLIAGGIGVTPIRALLEDESLDGDIVVLYRVRTPADAVLLGELRNLARLRGARLHLLTGRTVEGNQPFSPENLRGLVPDITERDVYVCGPAAMTNAVLHSLRALRVPARQRHAEVFRLAA